MLNEISTNRILHHFQNDKTLAIISTFRTERTEKENLQLLKQFKSEIKKLKLGFSELISRWSEQNQDTNEIETSDERSLMIYGISLNDAMKFGQRYNQSSIIFKSSEKCAEVCTVDFIDYDGKEHNVGSIVRTFDVKSKSPLNINIAKEIFSKRISGPASKPIKSKHAFKLESVFEVESNHASTFATKERYIKVL